MLPHVRPELEHPKSLPWPWSASDDSLEAEIHGSQIFSSEIQFPLAVLLESAVRQNSGTMAAYCARHDVSLAPHGKTTMAPALFQIQLDDGAWGITAATVWQARTMRAAGVSRVLIANEVTTVPEIRWLASVLTTIPSSM